MNKYTELLNQIMALPVFDTHTHLETGYRQPHEGLYARSFFDICDYFWFKRELIAVGYHKGAEVDPTSLDAATELHASLQEMRNTVWARTVMQAMENLFGIRPDSPQRILELSEVMSKSVENRQWGLQVCDKIGIQNTVMGPGGGSKETRVDVDVLGDRIVRVPIFQLAGKFVPGYDENNPECYQHVDEIKASLKTIVDSYITQGWKTVRVNWLFHPDAEKSKQKDFTPEELKDRANLDQYFGHFLLECLQEHGFSIQVFFGGGSKGPENNPLHVPRLNGIFERYPGLKFELFSMAELSSMDMVQAARIYPNVYPGGMWWYTFRPSIYEMNMRYRVEALPPSRCTFVASDARCIEWSYIKILLIKTVMTRFFHDQIEKGWLDEDAALFTARHWLHDTAASLYLPK